MSVTATLGPGAVLPPVHLVITGDDLPEGAPWVLTGSTASGWTWRVRGGEGVGEGTQVVLSDVLAPAGTPVTYTLTVDGQAPVGSGSVTRPLPGRTHAVMRVDGVDVARVRVLGDDEDWSERRVHTTTVWGQPLPAVRLAPVAGAGGGTLTLLSEPPHTDTLRSLLRTNQVLALVHNPASADVPGVDTPPIRLILVIADQSRSIGTDLWRRVWSWTWLAAPDPYRGVRRGLQTWADLDAVELTVAQWDALGLTAAQVDTTIWGDVGA